MPKRTQGFITSFLLVCLSLFSLLLAACGATNTSVASTPAPTTAAPMVTTVAATTVPAATTIPAATTVPATNTTVATATTVTATGELTIFAAASLTDSFNEIKGELEKINPGLKITYNFAGSNQLRTQLEQGAKADIFASADQTQMDNAAKSGLVDGKGTIFVRNRLAIIVPKNNSAKIEKVQDLAKTGIKFVTAQKDVPVGTYTLDALDKMSKDAAFGADFSTKVQANIVSREANVKQVVSKVQLGEADAGVVYISDVTPNIASQLTTIDIPDQFNTIATYPISILKGGSNSSAAKVFVDYVLSPAGQTILKKNNFVPVIMVSVTNSVD